MRTSRSSAAWSKAGSRVLKNMLSCSSPCPGAGPTRASMAFRARSTTISTASDGPTNALCAGMACARSGIPCSMSPAGLDSKLTTGFPAYVCREQVLGSLLGQ